MTSLLPKVCLVLINGSKTSNFCSGNQFPRTLSNNSFAALSTSLIKLDPEVQKFPPPTFFPGECNFYCLYLFKLLLQKYVFGFYVHNKSNSAIYYH